MTRFHLHLVVLVGCLLACDSPDDSDMQGPDGGPPDPSTLACLDVLTCAGDCSGTGCEDQCVDRGTLTAQAQVLALVTCVSDAGCVDASISCIQANCSAELTACTGSGAELDGGTSPGTGAGTFEGSIGGRSLDVEDSIFYVPTASNGDQGVLIMLASSPGLCGSSQANQIVPDSTAMTFQLYNLEGDDLVDPTPGVYQVGLGLGTGKSATAIFHAADPVCSPTNTFFDSGTITLTEVSATRAVGTYELSSDGSSASGSFDALFCDLSNQAPGEPTCP